MGFSRGGTELSIFHLATRFPCSLWVLRETETLTGGHTEQRTRGKSLLTTRADRPKKRLCQPADGTCTHRDLGSHSGLNVG